MKNLALIAVLAPLVGSILSGFGGKWLGAKWSHRLAILAVLVSFAMSLLLFYRVLNGESWNGTIYTWFVTQGLSLEIGFWIDRLSVLMLLVVTFVSLMVHIYTIGYMQGDSGYQRFFSYINLFTFSMLMLVLANNFLQLFFGWEAVGLVSYLLIGFWYTRESAIYANLKAFLVNRVGDFGFILGIALIATQFGTLDYVKVFAQLPDVAHTTITLWPGAEVLLVTLICLCLFVGAMGKSAQFPLHVWLPDSMEGPTPISALIHAATMVTAGIFMVSRMSPLFELSTTALVVVMAVGAITAFFMGLVAIVQNDIKKVVAYSTLSQLGYMTAALGVSAYPVAMFHLTTHAFFKALLFLGAGSVIVALHHEQDMRRMGGLKKIMPITYFTMLIGTLAIIGFPGFSGFYSKESIIDAVYLSNLPGASVAYVALMAGVFITSLYSFRLLFLVFHGASRFETHGGHDGHAAHPPHESPWVITLPLILLAVPSVAAGWWLGGIVFGSWFDASIYISEAHPVLHHLHEEFTGVWLMALHGVATLPFWLLIAGFVCAWYGFLYRPSTAQQVRHRLSWLAAILERKYGIDELYVWFFAKGSRALGAGLWKRGDQGIIDGIINGSARTVGNVAGLMRLMQSGRIPTYVLGMMLGVFLMLALWIRQFTY